RDCTCQQKLRVVADHTRQPHHSKIQEVDRRHECCIPTQYSFSDSYHWKPNLLDMGSLLIKPVQRIMKYPLLLGELWHATPEDHPDYQPLQEAFTAAKIINVNINEFKRRKDIVMKYKRLEDDGTLRGKLHKLNIHSIRKKGDRFAGYLKILTGADTQVKQNEVFDKEEKFFRSLEKAVRQLVKNVQCYLQYTQEMVSVAFHSVQDVKTIVKDSNKNDANGLVHDNGNDPYKHFRDDLEHLVLTPLSSLHGMFTAPQKLIQKRYDKLLDYCSRLEQDPPGPAKRDYEALNALLVEELQRFNRAAYTILTNSVVFLVALLRELMNNALIGAPSPPLSNIAEVQNSIMDELNNLTFVKENAQKLIERKVSFEKRDKKIMPEVQHQTEEQRAWLLAEYPVSQLYQLKRKCNGCQEQDLSLLEGELVALIEDTDPMGSSSRWLVHTGGAQGYVYSTFLKQYNPLRDSQRAGQMYYAVYAFQARCEQELTLQEYQHVRILQFCDLGGNKEWWLAEANGQKGYVPANYLGRMSYA
uniref:Dynamin-binding protein n=1 Tax=Amphilophus citrinellus TaxID=61819 RepID=A0A3Q0SUA4_AMPCI